MPGANFVLDKGYLAAVAIGKFLCVKVGAGDELCTIVTGTNDAVLGVSQEAATAQDALDGRVIDIRLMGITMCVAQAAIARGAKVRAHSSGKVTTLAGTAGLVENIVGIALETVTTDGDWLHVLLTPGVITNTAAS
jgi:hypothetical protein